MKKTTDWRRGRLRGETERERGSVFVLKADKTRLTVVRRELVTSGSVNVYPVRFEFSEDWDGLTRTAVFRAGDKSRSVLLDGGNEAVIPWEVLETPNLQLFCGVYGARDGGAVLPTVWADMGPIWRGAKPSEEEAQPPTPDIWEQKLDAKADGLDYDGLNLSLTSGDRALSTVQIAGGGRGDGVPGKDGFSPTVETEPADGGTAVTITDANGPHSFTVRDGKDGEPGPPGETGPKGDPGAGVPAGGEAGQVLAKSSGADYDTEWVDPPEGGGASAFLVKAPVGTIVIWSGTEDNVPKHWALCDGEDGRPDLRDRFVLGAGDRHPVGDNGGSETVKLTVDEMPAHKHEIDGKYGSNAAVNTTSTASGGYLADAKNGTTNRSSSYSVATGSNHPHENMPPYYALCYIIKLTRDETDGAGVTFTPAVSEAGVISWTNDGDLPNPDPVNIMGPRGEDGAPGEPGREGEPGKDASINGENVLTIEAGDNVSLEQEGDTLKISFAPPEVVVNAPIGAILPWSGGEEPIPEGWHICDGEEGTVDLRDKFILGAGPNHPAGEEGGAEKVTLTVNEMPSHTHPVSGRANSTSFGSTAYFGRISGGTSSSITSTATGGSQPHNNMPPYLALFYIQKIDVTPTDYVTEERAKEIAEEYGGSKEAYSSEEAEIGTWMGKPLYRKAYEITVGNDKYTKIDEIKGAIIRFTKGYITMRGGGYATPFYSSDAETRINSSGEVVQLVNTVSETAGSTASIVIEYTKD